MATFITSKLTGQTISISVNTSTGYWKYNHNGSDSSVFSSISPPAPFPPLPPQTITVANANGEFTIISCLSDGTVSGNITNLNLSGNNQITTFDGTGLSSLTYLNLNNNGLTSFNGTGLSSLTTLILYSNQLTSFNGTGLSGLTSLSLTNNPLTTFIGGDMGLITSLDFRNNIAGGWNITTLETFDGTGLSSLTGLNLTNNPLTTFIGGDMGLITELDFSGWNITTLETFDGTGLSGLTTLDLSGNGLTSLDVLPMTSLTELYLADAYGLNGNPMTATANNTILSGLVTNGNSGGNFYTSGGRTADGTADYDTLIGDGWNLLGLDLSPTFITSNLTGETINIDIETSEGFWKYFHDGVWSEVYDSGTYTGSFEIEVTAEDGEFTLTSCDDEGTISGDITYLDLNSNGLTSFDGTGLTGLTVLYLYGNQLTGFTGTGLSGLTYLNLSGNGLTSFNGTDLSSLTELYLGSFLDKNGSILVSNNLTSFDGTGLSSLTDLELSNNPLTTFIGGDMGLITSLDFYSNWNITTLETFDGNGLSGLTELGLGNNGLTSFNGTGLTDLTRLNLDNNPLTTFIGGDMGLITSLDFSVGNWNITTLETFDGTGLSGLTSLNLSNNQLTSFNGTGLSGLTSLSLTNNPLTTFIGGDMGLITSLDFSDNLGIATLETFDGTGLSSLTNLILDNNQLTSFDGTGLSSLTTLKLKDNPLTTFIGGDMGLITSLDFNNWNITTLETFNGTGLTSLQQLILNNNQIVLLDVTPITNLSQLELTDNPITPQNWDSILSGLVDLGNEDGNLKVGTTQRTNASTADYDTLISRNWVIDGTFEVTPLTPTFITSQLTGEIINIDIETSEGFWKYYHDGVWSEVYDSGTYTGSFEIEVTAEDGEFTLTSCDDEGTISGDITYLDLNNNGLTEFDGTGLTGLTQLYLYGALDDALRNQLTEFDGTPLTSLTDLDLGGNQLTSFNGTGLSSLTELSLNNNGLTSFNGTGLSGLTKLDLGDNPLTTFIGGDMGQITSLYFNKDWSITTLETFDGTGLSGLTDLDLNNNGLTSFDGTGLSGLTYLNLGENQLTSFNGTDLTSLTDLYLPGNLLTGLDVSPMTSLTSLYLSDKGVGNPLTSAAIDSILNQLEANGLENGNFSTINWRTDAGTTDFNTLISRGWQIWGANLKPTFKVNMDGFSLTFQITVDTTSGFWKYFHDGSWSEVFDTGNYAGGVEITPSAGDGEFILESCDDEGNKDGDIIEISCKDSSISEFYGDQLGTLVILDLSGNQLESLDVSPMTNLTQLITSDNSLTASANDSILNGLESNGLINGVFTTTGGRTSAGTADYNTLISRGWTIEGAGIPTWYRFKAPSTESWDGVIGVDANKNIKEVWLYQSGGFTYYDFLTLETIGEVKFNVQGTEIEIVATQVPVTLQEFSSSGSFTAGVGFDAGGGDSIGYGNTTAFGNWGTLNSGTLPAIPSRYEGEVPAGSVIFSNIATADFTFCLITAPILLSLTVNGNEIGLKDVYGSSNGASFPFELVNGETYIFSMTWGELVEATPLRKLRVKGLTQRN